MSGEYAEHRNWKTTTQAAEALGVTPRRIQAMIKKWIDAGQPRRPGQGQLKAEKAGDRWFVNPKDLDHLRDRTPGRPPEKGGR